jgi:peptidoglycan/xylan/chitin deacetylase (PgdA/CDA1 family)
MLRRLAAAAGALALVAVVAVLVLRGGGGADPPPAPRPTATAAPTAGATPRPRRRPAALPAAPADLRGAAARRLPVPILMYHVVSAAPAGTPNPELWVDQKVFAAEMQLLRRRGYHAITLRQAFDAWQHGGPLPRRPVVVSFDDGYLSQYTHARPVLRALGWPGVLNLELRNLGPGGVTEREVRGLIAAGWEIDSHTLTHPDLTTVDDTRLRKELTGSRSELRRRFGAHVAEFFCYPAGRYDARVVAAVRAAGSRGATTVDEGYGVRAAAFTLRRVRVNASDTPATLLARLGPSGRSRRGSAVPPPRLPAPLAEPELLVGQLAGRAERPPRLAAEAERRRDDQPDRPELAVRAVRHPDRHADDEEDRRAAGPVREPAARRPCAGTLMPRSYGLAPSRSRGRERHAHLVCDRRRHDALVPGARARPVALAVAAELRDRHADGPAVLTRPEAAAGRAEGPVVRVLRDRHDAAEREAGDLRQRGRVLAGGGQGGRPGLGLRALDRRGDRAVVVAVGRRHLLLRRAQRRDRLLGDRHDRRLGAADRRNAQSQHGCARERRREPSTHAPHDLSPRDGPERQTY